MNGRAGCEGRERGGRGRPEGPLEPRNVAEASELPPDRREDSDRAEAESFVEPNRGGIRESDPRNDPLQVLARYQMEQPSIQERTQPLSLGLRSAVDRSLHGRVVAGPRPEATGARPSKDLTARTRGDDQPVPARSRVLFEPGASVDDRYRLDLERRARVHYVVVVDVEYRFGVARTSDSYLNALSALHAGESRLHPKRVSRDGPSEWSTVMRNPGCPITLHGRS